MGCMLGLYRDYGKEHGSTEVSSYAARPVGASANVSIHPLVGLIGGLGFVLLFAVSVKECMFWTWGMGPGDQVWASLNNRSPRML